MEKESHIQGAFYCIDNFDYYVSINQETLKKIKEGNIIKSKIVYHSKKVENIRELIKKNLFITLLTDEERIKNMGETKIIYTTDSVRLKISDRLLNILIGDNPKKEGEEEGEEEGKKELEEKSEKKLKEESKEGPENYTHRYNAGGDKIHFLIKDKEEPFSEKSGFDDTFELCEKLNKELPEQLDLFESDYINVYKPGKDKD